MQYGSHKVIRVYIGDREVKKMLHREIVAYIAPPEVVKVDTRVSPQRPKVN